MRSAASWDSDPVRRSRSNVGCSHMSAEPSELIDRFCDALWLEQGLSQATLSAYRSDLVQVERFLRARDCENLTRATRDDLLAYLERRRAEQVKSRTAARLLSTLRRFYRYLAREGRI